MRVAYYPLHYGSDYLGWSIRSIYGVVDKIYILYTPEPSQGYRTNLTNPDNEESLKVSAFMDGDPQNKIVWINGRWGNEGEHRNYVNQVIKGLNVDLILAMDSDEIWPEDSVESLIKESFDKDAGIGRVRMLTLWRSFSWHCLDEMWPIRIIRPNSSKNDVVNLGLNPEKRIFHFGYARKLVDIEYKMSVQGHRGEWRPEWYDRYKNWPLSGNEDLHPVCNNVWTASRFNKESLPIFLKNHPYYNLEVI